jgi:hypothetical protein
MSELMFRLIESDVRSFELRNLKIFLEIPQI